VTSSFHPFGDLIFGMTIIEPKIFHGRRKRRMVIGEDPQPEEKRNLMAGTSFNAIALLTM
jgi:hypothetical protein